MQRLNCEIKRPSLHLSILLGDDVYNSLDTSILRQAEKWIILVDRRIERSALDPLVRALERGGLSHSQVQLSSGEKVKSRRRKEELENRLFMESGGKRVGLIAVGGGTLLDLAGFLAATFARGIPFISIPTTLLAMTDACLGGKCAVNTRFAKNSIGAFHFPSAILIDFSHLRSLPQAEIRSGLIESVKHGLIYDEKLFEFIQSHLTAIFAKKEDLLQELIMRSLSIKKEIVEKDPFEKGERRLLNFGHTFGHALEQASDFKLSHGAAVGVGLLAESYASWRLKSLDKSALKRIEGLLLAIDLEVKNGLSLESILSAMRYDKKRSGQSTQISLLEKIGRCAYLEGSYIAPLTDELTRESLDYALSRFQLLIASPP